MKNYIRKITDSLRALSLPIFTLITCCGISFYSWQYAVQLDRARISNILMVYTLEARSALDKRIKTYSTTLRDMRAFFDASADVTPQEFTAYADNIDIKHNYPDTHRFGYLMRYDLPSGSERPYAVRYVYASPSAPEIIGVDATQDPIRKEALERARDEDMLIVTRKTFLISDIGKRHVSAFLIYLPVYRPNVPHRTLAERRRNLKGYVFASFYPQELAQSVFSNDFLNRFDVRIYDSPINTKDHLLFGGLNRDSRSAIQSKLYEMGTTLQVGGQAWTLAFTARPAFIQRLNSDLPGAVLASGILATLLLTGISWCASWRRRDITSRLTQNLQFRSLFENNPDGVCLTDTEGNFQRVNEALSHIFGMRSELLAGVNYRHFIAAEDMSRVDWHEKQTKRGIHQHFEASIVNISGERRILAVNKVPIIENRQVTGIFTICKDITDRKQKERQLAYLAEYDQLTGLPNRSLLMDRLNHAMTRAKREGQTLALLFLDLDKFKDINDSMGHAAGDMVLRTAAERLQQCLRESDTVARLGGDEFTVLLEDVEDATSAVAIAEKILHAFALPVTFNERELFLTTSIGIALYPSDADTLDAMLKAADMAMYAAKSNGRNNCKLFHPSMLEQASTKIDIKTELNRALQRNELSLHYQPQFDIETGHIVGAEALLRWQHPRLGVISPECFIPLAEETGAIQPIGEWVIRSACRQATAWQMAGLPPINIAVNVSARQFKDPKFDAFIHRVLQETQMPAERLELEITEGLLMEDAQASEQMLRALKAAGIKICIDDFGTGYCSLSYLVNFPLDVLKIDRAFMRHVVDNDTDAVVAETIIHLAHRLALEIVAEGVETEAQVEFLRAHKSQNVQGYFFSKPLPVDDMTHLLMQQHLKVV